MKDSKPIQPSVLACRHLMNTWKKIKGDSAIPPEELTRSVVEVVNILGYTKGTVEDLAQKYLKNREEP